jgi:hypothetical protein
MQKLIAANAKLQQKSEEKIKQNLPTGYPQRSARLVPVDYAFVPLPVNIEDLIPTPGALGRSLIAYFSKMMQWIREGQTQLTLYTLASRMKVNERTIRRWNDALEALGALRIIRRKLGHKLNDTHGYRLACLEKRVVDIFVHVKEKVFLKTNTPTAARGPFQNNHPAFRQLVEEKRSLEADKVKRVQYTKTLEAENCGLRSIVRGRDHSLTAIQPDSWFNLPSTERQIEEESIIYLKSKGLYENYLKEQEQCQK